MRLHSIQQSSNATFTFLSSSLKSSLQILNSGSGQPSITVSTAREKASYEGQALVPFYSWHNYYIFKRERGAGQDKNNLSIGFRVLFVTWLIMRRYVGWGVCHEPIAAEILNLFEVIDTPLPLLGNYLIQMSSFWMLSEYFNIRKTSSHLHFFIQTPLPQRDLGFSLVEYSSL